MIMKLLKCALLASLINLAAAGCAMAVPSMLNNVPTTDIVDDGNFLLMLNYFGYDYNEPQDLPTSSPVYSLQYGFKKCELGFDYVSKSDFVDNGLYPGKMAWNFKWRILTEGSDPVSLAVGAFYLGTKSYNNQYYGSSPYFVFSKQIKDARLHLGYQTNLLGAREVDDDNKKSRGVIVGLDGVIYDHPKNPVTLYLDYTGGPLATYGFGLYQPINPSWSWTYSFFKPAMKTLPVSGGELPDQHWFGVCYTIPTK